MTVCDLCKGTGRLLNPWYDTTGAMTGMTGDICFMCDGKGTIGEQMTNEEYLRSANVNDMATMIATKLLELARHEYGMCDVVDRDIVLEWLKEKHTE